MIKTVSMEVELKNGIGAAKAQKVVQAASEFESEITLKYERKEVDLKSILGILSLAVLEGAHIEIEAQGEDAEQAIKTLKEMLVEK